MPEGDAPVVVQLNKFTVKVQCAASHGHSVGGLFVLLRPKRVEGSGNAARIADVLEELNGSAPTGDGIIDGHFFVALVGPTGFLEITHERNPWPQYFNDKNPHTLKLSPLQKYEGVLVRHPDWVKVGAFARYLGFNENAQQFESTWGKRADVVKQLSIQVDSQNGSQLVLDVPEDASAYVPPGGCGDGWVLYADMPHKDCPSVASAVKALQTDLAKLCFPVGPQEIPFQPGSSPSKASGRFDGTVQAAVGRFQEHAEAGEAFQVLESARPATPASTYAYLLGQAFRPDKTLTGYTLGVVDADTEASIRSWVDNGLRKPGQILLQLSTKIGTIAMLDTGAVAVEAWAQLVRAFGCEYGLVSGHSFRSVLNKGTGAGIRLNSIHKTGLALDFAGGATARTTARFPIRFEAHWMRNNWDIDSQRAAVAKAKKNLATKQANLTQAQTNLTSAQAHRTSDATASTARRAADDAQVTRAQRAVDRAQTDVNAAQTRLDTEQQRLDNVQAAADADTHGAKDKWRVRWRLYGHSTLNMFGLFAHGIDTLKANLDRYEADLRGILREHFGTARTLPEADAMITQLIAPYVATAARLRALEPNELRSKFFRATVRQWMYNTYEVDGGSRSPDDWSPLRSAPDFPPASFAAASFVNITALGAECGMARIGGNRVKDKSVGKDGKTTDAQFGVAKNAWTLAQLLVYLKHLPDRRHANDPITIIRGKTRLTPTYKPADIDADFVKAWIDDLSPMQTKGLVSLTGADLSITLPGTSAGETAVRKVLDKVGGYRGKRVLVVSAGVRTTVTASGIQDTSAVKTALGGAIDAMKKAAKDVSTPRQSTQRNRNDWTVVLRPVLVAANTPDDVRFEPNDAVELPAPPSSNLENLWRPLEWWHYQHESAADVAWGDLLETCGYSSAVLQGADPPVEGETIFPRSVGYDASNFPDTSGGCGVGVVENSDPDVPDGG